MRRVREHNSPLGTAHAYARISIRFGTDTASTLGPTRSEQNSAEKQSGNRQPAGKGEEPRDILEIAAVNKL